MKKILSSTNVSLLSGCEMEELEQRMETSMILLAGENYCPAVGECMTDCSGFCGTKCEGFILRCDDHSCDDKG